MKEFGISRTIAILPISLFLMGLGTGPLLVGPLSEVHGGLYRSVLLLNTEFPRSQYRISMFVPRFLHLQLAGSICPQRWCVLVPFERPKAAPPDHRVLFI